MTRNGVLVCWHDPHFVRAAGVATAIAQTCAARLAEIELPAGSSVCRRGEGPGHLTRARVETPHRLDVDPVLVNDVTLARALLRSPVKEMEWTPPSRR